MVAVVEQQMFVSQCNSPSWSYEGGEKGHLSEDALEGDWRNLCFLDFGQTSEAKTVLLNERRRFSGNICGTYCTEKRNSLKVNSVRFSIFAATSVLSIQLDS